jgi:putative ATPase
MELFENHIAVKKNTSFAPLAERLRPKKLEEFVGQQHLLGSGKPLTLLLQSGQLPSIIFWGPPGCGKTTLALILAANINAEFYKLNAVSSGVQDVRKVIERAEINRNKLGKRTILFIDEIHRFNKAQQDALLHSVEDGIMTLIGATTENPSFEVISPLLSRCMVYILEPLTASDLNLLIDHALKQDPLLNKHPVVIGAKEREALMLLSGGDARVLLNGLETAFSIVKPSPEGKREVTVNAIEEAFQRRNVKYDKGGEEHYNIISAFIKSMRGSDPDATLYWMAKMIYAGEDPLFIARRIVIAASEDVGNADPRALFVATAAYQAVERIGMPEGALPLAQAAVYIASAPKSNASYLGIKEAMKDIEEGNLLPVPDHLKDAHYKGAGRLGRGRGYKYPHDYPGHYTAQDYLPQKRAYYRPTEQGEEKRIKERLAGLQKRYQEEKNA